MYLRRNLEVKERGDDRVHKVGTKVRSMQWKLGREGTGGDLVHIYDRVGVLLPVVPLPVQHMDLSGT